ncbi:MAG: hypothetical protein WA790_06265 [Sulfitobacter sp.]
MLAMMLALTSQSMAVARGASAATGQMVLCTGAGPVAVYTDATGQPTSAPHICPDSALNVTVAGPAQIFLAPKRLVQFQRATPLVAWLAPVSPRLAPPSRGPPIVV